MVLMLKWRLKTLVEVLRNLLLKDMMTLFLILDWWLKMIDDLYLKDVCAGYSLVSLFSWFNEWMHFTLIFVLLSGFSLVAK